MVYVTTLLSYKITILLLCLRLFGVNRNFRRCTWALMFFVFGYLFSNLLTEIFGCMPISKAYQPETPGHCIDSIRVGLVYGAMNIASDLFIFVLPLPMVWRLQLTVYEKLGVSFIFMNGAMYITSFRKARNGKCIDSVLQKLHIYDFAIQLCSSQIP